MKILHKAKDGGPDSNVTGYWLIESKKYFSIVLLKFDKGYREAFHSHAFNAWSWILSGRFTEEVLHTEYLKTYKKPLHHYTWFETYFPSIFPIVTPKDRAHRIKAPETAWAISFRGPWDSSWTEFSEENNTITTLTEGGVVSETRPLKPS